MVCVCSFSDDQVHIDLDGSGPSKASLNYISGPWLFLIHQVVSHCSRNFFGTKSSRALEAGKYTVWLMLFLVSHLTKMLPIGLKMGKCFGTVLFGKDACGHKMALHPRQSDYLRLFALLLQGMHAPEQIPIRNSGLKLSNPVLSESKRHRTNPFPSKFCRKHPLLYWEILVFK